MLAVRDKCPALKTIVQMEKLDPAQVVEAEAKDIKLVSFEEVLKDVRSPLDFIQRVNSNSWLSRAKLILARGKGRYQMISAP